MPVNVAWYVLAAFFPPENVFQKMIKMPSVASSKPALEAEGFLLRGRRQKRNGDLLRSANQEMPRPLPSHGHKKTSGDWPTIKRKNREGNGTVRVVPVASCLKRFASKPVLVRPPLDRATRASTCLFDATAARPGVVRETQALVFVGGLPLQGTAALTHSETETTFTFLPGMQLRVSKRVGKRCLYDTLHSAGTRQHLGN